MNILKNTSRRSNGSKARISRRKLFGVEIKSLRRKSSLSLRGLARQVGVTASYLSDIESLHRKPPSKEVIQRLAVALGVTEEDLFDLAGLHPDRIPPDVPDIVKTHPESVNLLRALKQHQASAQRIRELTRKIGSIEVKALLLAAGLGSRMRPLTQELPKCMAIVLNGRTLLETQLDTLRSCGISRISVVRGYKAEKITAPGVKYYENTDPQNTNMLSSLFCAEEELDGEVVISYTDIWYEGAVVRRLLRCEKDIAIGVDIDWKEYYLGRKDHPIEEAENVIFNSNNEVMKIGKIAAEKEEVHGEFIGMMKLTRRGCEILRRHYHRAKALYDGGPFQRAGLFQKAYLTDLFQEMADLGVSIHCEIIGSGWKEIDTLEDFKKAVTVFQEKGGPVHVAAASVRSDHRI